MNHKIKKPFEVGTGKYYNCSCGFFTNSIDKLHEHLEEKAKEQKERRSKEVV